MNNYENKMKITLGNKEWFVPVLVAKQNKIIDPIIIKLLPTFANLKNGNNFLQISEQEYNDLLEISYIAIIREHKEMTREKFLEMPITLPELINAFSVIAQQTGIFRKVDNEEFSLGE
ncbi:MAG: hypothetical protein WCJ33_04095 [Pseudomonadota bacterium]